MSLIADALKAAREEKEKRTGADAGERRARTLFGSSGGRGRLRVPTPSRRRGVRGRRFAGALFGAGALVALALGLHGLRSAGTAGEPVPEGAGAPSAAESAVTAAGGSEDGPVASAADEGTEGGAAGGEAGGDADGDVDGERLASGGGPAAGGAAGGASGEAAGGAGGDGPVGGDRVRPGGDGDGPGGPDAVALAAVDPLGGGDGASASSDEDPGTPDRERGELTVSVDRADPGARTAFERAVAAQRAGELEGALALYEEAVRLDPDNARIHNNLGTVRRSLGHLRGAREAYRRAIELAPDYAAAWNNLGIVLDRLGRSADARAAFEESIRLDPAAVGTKVNLGTNYHTAGMHEEARRLLEEAVAEDPRRPEAHYALGRALEALSEADAAIHHYRRFLITADGGFPDLEARVRSHLRTLGAGGGMP